MLTLGASIKHELEAREESALLLTIAWPIGEKLQGDETQRMGNLNILQPGRSCCLVCRFGNPSPYLTNRRIMPREPHPI